MIPGLDSSYVRPNAASVAAARGAGIRLWGGYLASRDGLGLAMRWSQQDFQVIQDGGLRAIGFCSGWDDPGWIRETAAAWGILACVDVETGIRTDGPWVRDWVQAAGAGLYGLASVHYAAGEPVGRGAAFNIVADYLAVGCTGETWPSWLPRPARCGWQCQGDHQELGLSVDRGWYDDWFAPDPAPGQPIPAGGTMLARCPDPNHPRRFDACFVRPDNHVMHLYSEDGMVGLAQEQNLLDLGTLPGAPAVPGLASCIWEDDSTLTFVAEATDGSLWLRQESIAGAIQVDWNVFGLGGQAVGLPVGPKGDPGPAGPATYVKHRHGQTDTGTPA